MTSRRRLRAVVGSASLVAASFVTIPLAQSSTITALVSGTVLSSGQAVPRATVSMIAWPARDTTPAGGTVPTLTLATTRTSVNGAYSLKPNLASVPTAYREHDGTVNVDVDAESGPSIQTFSLPVAAAGTQGAQDSGTAVAGTRAAAIKFDTLQHTVTTSVGAAASAVTATPDTAAAAARSTITSPAVSPDGGRRGGSNGCLSWTKVKQYPLRKEVFMNLYAWSGASGTVDETSSSKHSLGVGTAVTGGAWSAEGDVTKETNLEAGATRTHTHHLQLGNSMEIGHYVRKCHVVRKIYYDHEQRAMYFDALQDHMSTINTSPFIPYSYCVSYSSGDYRKKVGSNITFNGGLDGPFINVKANAQYSSETNVTFHIKSLTFLCGSNTYWATSKTAGVEEGYKQCGGGVMSADAVKPAC